MRNILLFCFIFMMSYANAQLQIEVRSLQSGETIDMEEYPVSHSWIKVTNDGTPVDVKKSNLVLTEISNSAIPTELTVEGEWTKITWITPTYDFRNYGFNYSVQVFYSHDGNSALRNLSGNFDLKPRFGFYDEDSKRIFEHDWGFIPPGPQGNPNSVPVTIKLRGRIEEYKNGGSASEEPIYLDSITTDSEFFRVEWMGSDADPDKSPPPRELQIDFYYWISVFFEPKTTDVVTGFLKAHFNNGFTAKLPLKGNNYEIQNVSSLKLLEPNEGVFTPCETVNIRWEGHIAGSPVVIYYSTNDGNEWTKIDNTNGSEYQWQVPPDISDNVRIKIEQKFQQKDDYNISISDYATKAVAYDPEGAKAVLADIRGNVYEYDLYSDPGPQVITKGKIPNYSDVTVIGTYYSDASEEFGVLIRNNSTPYEGRQDSVIFYKSGNNIPVRKAALPENFRSDQTEMLYDQSLLAVVPELGSEVIFVDPKTAELEEKIIFDRPVRDFNFSRSGIAQVTLYSNEVKIINMNDLSIIKNYDFKDQYIIQRSRISPDGKFLVFHETQPISGQFQKSYLFDMDINAVVRQFTTSTGVVVGFGYNDVSSTLAIGSQYGDQVTVFNLSNYKSFQSLEAQDNILTGLYFAPDGNSMISTSNGGDLNVVFRTFSSAESDVSENRLRIVPPVLSNEEIEIEADYLGHETEHSIVSIKNIGEKFIDIESLELSIGYNFSLVNEWERDTLYPGENLEIFLNYKPLEVGEINDSLVFSTCVYKLKVPLRSKGLARNITILSDVFDVGEACVGDTLITQEIDIFRNDDPVPLIVNGFTTKQNGTIFRIASEYNQYQVVPAGGIFSAKIRFTPFETGEIRGILEIYHSDQQKRKTEFNVKGFGIGSEVEISHPELFFIPEITERTFTIKNLGNRKLSILNASTSPEGFFTANNNYPIEIETEETGEISVNLTKVPESGSVKLILDAEPCLQANYIDLKILKGNSNITLPDITVKPTEKAKIPITYENNENGDYNGERFFRGEFTVKEKLFLPLEVDSDHGEGRVVSQSVENGIRTFSIEVNGEFPSGGTAATIVGVPGLTDSYTTYIDLKANDVVWGSTIDNTVTNGSLTVDPVNKDRKILSENSSVQITGIKPNPAGETFTASFESKKKADGYIEIYNPEGKKVLKTDPINFQKGKNEITLNISFLIPGTYRLVIITEGKIAGENLIISR